MRIHTWFGMHRVTGVSGLLSVALAASLFGAPASAAPPVERAKVNSDLLRLLHDFDGEPVKAWVFLTDKGFASLEAEQIAIDEVAATYNRRAYERRVMRATTPELFSARDLPVADRYIKAIEDLGATVHVESKWLNAISASVSNEDQIEAIAQLPFVTRLQPVSRSVGIAPVDAKPADGPFIEGGFYGYAEDQLLLQNSIALHEHGFTGEGVVIGVLDTGFRTSHEAFHHPDKPLNIIAAWDFINNDGNVGEQAGDDPDQHVHGTLILGTLAAYQPNSLVGGAFDADYILAKTEDITDEYQQEEDFYVAGLEFIEANGGDVATSSLGYLDWYTQNDLDGETAVTTIAVNEATALGMHCCTAAGNNGHDQNPNTSSLIAPSDAFQVYACGAVEYTGEIAGFSSDGPTADGRVKPEILAVGDGTYTIWPWEDEGFAQASGTSLSTPLVAGAIGCLTQARRAWSVDELRTHVLESGDWYRLNGSFDSDYVYGYGVLDALYAAQPLMLEPLVPGVAGQQNTLRATGGTPGIFTFFVWGTSDGAKAIPGCPGATVYIQQPKIATKIVADSNGVAERDVFVPNGAGNLSIVLQALEINTCRISNTVTQTIQ